MEKEEERTIEDENQIEKRNVQQQVQEKKKKKNRKGLQQRENTQQNGTHTKRVAVQNGDVYHRLNFLYQLAHHVPSKNLQRFYISSFLQLSNRSVSRM